MLQYRDYEAAKVHTGWRNQASRISSAPDQLLTGRSFGLSTAMSTDCVLLVEIEPNNSVLQLEYDAIAHQWLFEALSHQVATPSELEVSSSAADLTFVKEILGLNITETAQLFSVSRKTIYDWFGGTEPKRDGNSKKIETLRSALEPLSRNVYLMELRHHFETKIAGRSLISVVATEENPAVLNSFLAELLKMIEGAAPKQEVKGNNYDLGDAHISDLIREV